MMPQQACSGECSDAMQRCHAKIGPYRLYIMAKFNGYRYGMRTDRKTQTTVTRRSRNARNDAPNGTHAAYG